MVQSLVGWIRYFRASSATRDRAPGHGSEKSAGPDATQQIELDARTEHAARRHVAVRDLFASVAPRHAEGYSSTSLSGFVYTHRRELVAKKLSDFGVGADVLDVGCGAGLYARIAHDLGFSYHGIDSSPEMIAEARRAHGEFDGVEFAVGRVEHLNLPSGSFDVVLALGVLEYVSEDDLSVATNGLMRVLRPGGTLIMSALNRTSPVWQMRRAREAAKRARSWCSNRAYQPHAVETTFTSCRIRRLLMCSGLRLVEDSPYAFVVVPPAVYSRHPHVWSQAALRLERLSLTPLRFLSLAHLVVAKSPTAEYINLRTPTGAPKADVVGQRPRGTSIRPLSQTEISQGLR